MHQYIVDTEFAIRELFQLIRTEENAIAGAQDQLVQKQNELSGRQLVFQLQDLSEDFDDHKLQHAYNMVGQVNQEINELQTQISTLHATLLNKDFSLRSLAGSIFQISKQGISIVHGGLLSCPQAELWG